MNSLRYFSPDRRSGKMLVATRGWLQGAAVLAQNPNLETARTVRRALRLVPRYTMMSTRRLLALDDLIRNLDRNGILGDIVECGVWNGGSAAMMASACTDDARNFYLFDSFEGLPPPTERDGKDEHEIFTSGLCTGQSDAVREAFTVAGAGVDHLTITPGWFHDTLPLAAITDIALLHIDADWYDPVTLVLETFFDRVVPGGIVAIDDYGVWQGCRDAVNDFLKRRGRSDTPLHPVDHGMVYIEIPG